MKLVLVIGWLCSAAICASAQSDIHNYLFDFRSEILIMASKRFGADSIYSTSIRETDSVIFAHISGYEELQIDFYFEDEVCVKIISTHQCKECFDELVERILADRKMKWSKFGNGSYYARWRWKRTMQVIYDEAEGSFYGQLIFEPIKTRLEWKSLK